MTASRRPSFGIRLDRFHVDPDEAPADDITDAEIVDDPAPDAREPAGSEPVSGTVDVVPETDSASVARPVAGGVAVRLPDHVGAVVAGLYDQVRTAVADASDHPDGLRGGVYVKVAFGHTDSWAEHLQYAITGGGVPDSSKEGWVGPAINGAWHFTFGILFHAIGDLIKMWGTRPMSFFASLGLAGAILLAIHIALHW